MLKKLLLGLIVGIVILGSGSMVSADPIEIGKDMIGSALSWIDDNLGYAGMIYEFNDQETRTYAGATVVSNLFEVKGLDLAIGTDLDKAALVSLNYVFAKGGSLEPYINGGIGLDRIENLDLSNDEGKGEFLAFAGGGIKY